VSACNLPATAPTRLRRGGSVDVWTQALLLDRELQKAEPKRLRYRVLHVAARLAFHGRRGRLRLQHDWPWATELAAAFHKLKALPAATG
jgi:hypothetical protein